jgi:hypothetical protein
MATTTTSAERYLVRVQSYHYDPQTKGVKMVTIASRSMTLQGVKPILDLLQRTEASDQVVQVMRCRERKGRREKA